MFTQCCAVLIALLQQPRVTTMPLDGLYTGVGYKQLPYFVKHVNMYMKDPLSRDVFVTCCTCCSMLLEIIAPGALIMFGVNGMTCMRLLTVITPTGMLVCIGPILLRMNDQFASFLSRPEQVCLDVATRTINYGINSSDVGNTPYEGFTQSQCEVLCIENIDCVAFDYVRTNKSRACRFTTEVNHGIVRNTDPDVESDYYKITYRCPSTVYRNDTVLRHTQPTCTRTSICKHARVILLVK